MFAEFNELISSQSEKINDLNNCIAQQKEEHGKETGALSSAIDELTNVNRSLKEENTNVKNIVKMLESKIDEYGDEIQNVVNDLKDALEKNGSLESMVKNLNGEKADIESRMENLVANMESMEEMYRTQISSVKEELGNEKLALDEAK